MGLELITREMLIEGAKGFLYKQFCAKIKADEDEDDGRKIPFIISTASKDRAGDTISGKGWILDAYKLNPVVLWAHDQRGLPIAKASNIKKVTDGISSVAEFASAEVYAFADTVYRLIKGGFLNAVSVGFDPVEWKFRDTDGDRGIDFTRQELLEYSVVPVPANRDALRIAKGAGIDTAPIFAWAEEMLDHADDLIVLKMSGCSRELIEAARKEADPKQRVSMMFKGFLPIGEPVNPLIVPENKQPVPPVPPVVPEELIKDQKPVVSDSEKMVQGMECFTKSMEKLNETMHKVIGAFEDVSIELGNIEPLKCTHEPAVSKKSEPVSGKSEISLELISEVLRDLAGKSGK